MRRGGGEAPVVREESLAEVVGPFAMTCSAPAVASGERLPQVDLMLLLNAAAVNPSEAVLVLGNAGAPGGPPRGGSRQLAYLCRLEVEEVESAAGGALPVEIAVKIDPRPGHTIAKEHHVLQEKLLVAAGFGYLRWLESRPGPGEADGSAGPKAGLGMPPGRVKSPVSGFQATWRSH